MTPAAPGTMPGTDFPRAIGNPACEALKLAGLTQLDHVAAWRRRDLLELHGVGPKAIRVLADALAARNLAFADEGRPDDERPDDERPVRVRDGIRGARVP